MTKCAVDGECRQSLLQRTWKLISKAYKNVTGFADVISCENLSCSRDILYFTSHVAATGKVRDRIQ